MPQVSTYESACCSADTLLVILLPGWVLGSFMPSSSYLHAKLLHAWLLQLLQHLLCKVTPSDVLPGQPWCSNPVLSYSLHRLGFDSPKNSTFALQI